jgi:SAM-dependent methyltransferase
MATLTRVATRELMDDLGRSDRELRDQLRDLGWINRWFGAHAFVRRFLDRMLPAWMDRRAHDGSPLALLDVATGGADIPIAVADWAARRGVAARVTAVDRHPVITRLAREMTSRYPSITVLEADALALPFPDNSFDVCLCSLALHHLDPADGEAMLRELDRLARLGFLVMDLVRGWSGYVGVWLLTRCSRSPLTRHDGPISVRRARSWDEYRDLAAASGIPGLRLFKLALFRMGLARDG